ncbi:MAG: S46 family peptidase [Thermoanaerobaculaceae bacterium]
MGSLPRASSLLGAAITLNRWCAQKGKADLEREAGFQTRDERSIRMRLATLQRNLDVPTEKAVLSYFLRRAQALPAAQRIAALDRALADTGKTGEEAIGALLTRLFAATQLADQAVRMGALELDAEALAARRDPMLELGAELAREVRAGEAADRRLEGETLLAGAAYLDALAAFRNHPLYPDANGTIRFTFATVQGYHPRDGVFYTPFTTLEGVLAKHTGEEPFNCPPGLLLAHEKVGPGAYGDAALGALPVNFLSTNDITGGNSGSPIMNGKGELVGLAFDGNWESMTSDYEFDPAITRTINVDARYMLWVMEHVDMAHNLLREMGVPLGRQ